MNQVPTDQRAPLGKMGKVMTFMGVIRLMLIGYVMFSIAIMFINVIFVALSYGRGDTVEQSLSLLSIAFLLGGLWLVAIGAASFILERFVGAKISTPLWVTNFRIITLGAAMSLVVLLIT